MPRLLLETGLAAGSRHVLTFPFLNTDTAPLEMGAQLLDDLHARRPRYVVLPTAFEASMARCAGRRSWPARPTAENYLRTCAATLPVSSPLTTQRKRVSRGRRFMDDRREAWQAHSPEGAAESSPGASPGKAKVRR